MKYGTFLRHCCKSLSVMPHPLSLYRGNLIAANQFQA
jgi:hypothetical protein